MNISTTPVYHNATSHPVGYIAPAYGFIGIAISAIGYGTNFLPVKKFETGDGMFYQWIVANAIFLGSFVMNGILNFPKFEPFVLLGGIIWATGNICVVPVVKLIGLGIGLLLWNSASIIVGWASARFGWFGIKPQEPHNFIFNYVGFALIAISPLIYSFVKTEVTQEITFNINESIELSIQTIDTGSSEGLFKTKRQKCIKLMNKIIAIGLSLFSGVMYGLTYIPLTYVKNWYPNSSQRDLDYIFAQCSGIYLASSIYFLIYCIVKRNKPVLYPQCILPGIASGAIWFISYVGFFFANQALSQAISHPITSSLPGLISILITTVVFKEVKGLKNYIMIGIAIIITGIGATLTALSKII